MAAITHFSITQLPNENLFTLRVDGVLAILNQLYPIALEPTLTIEKILEDAPGRAFVKYKLHDNVNNLISNEATISYLWLNPDGGMVTSNVTLNINNNDQVILYDNIVLTNNVNYIKIEKITGFDNWKYKGQKIYPNQVFMVQDLPTLIFTAGATGGGQPYSVLSYFVGKESTVFDTTKSNDIILNLQALADISLLDTYVETYTINVGGVDRIVQEERHRIKISNAHINATAELDVVVNSAFLSLNALNRVYLGSEEYSVAINGTYPLVVNTNSKGEAEFFITNYYVFEGDAINGQLTIDLNSINTNPAFVNGVQSLTINTAL